MFDKFGRLLCPTCGEPMTRAAKFDSHRGGVMRTAFACETCEAVMMLMGRVPPAEAGEQRAGQQPRPIAKFSNWTIPEGRNPATLAHTLHRDRARHHKPLR